jgi:tetratricopeptide (TPR) repeat protein
MAIKYTLEERRVIPNWRDFERTVRMNELSVTGSVESKVDASHISRIIEDWKENPSIGTAADLINSCFIADRLDIDDVKAASKFVLQHHDKSSAVLFDIAGRINGADSSARLAEEFENNPNALEVESIDKFQASLNNHTIYRVVKRTKTKARTEMRNPIVWVELARFYAFFGHKEKAKRAMLIAIQLAPDNRYVLRSATRLFIHFEEHEMALYYLRGASTLKTDPWLISAHIATSSILGRYSPVLKNGIALISSNNYSDYELTELASSLGTLEFAEGSMKKAKQFLEKSTKSPNDNSLAQMEWLSQQDKAFSFNPSFFKNVPNPFEAFAFDAFQGGNYQECLNNCVNWFLDMPYSKRPILLGSYVTSMFLEDYKACVTLCKSGLQANPTDPTLLNNIVYSYLMLDKFDEAKPYLYQMFKMKPSQLETEELIPIQATFGLAAFKAGELKAGQDHYEKAIQTAREAKLEYLENIAVLVYARELITHNCEDKAKEYFSSIQNMNLRDSRELEPLRANVIAMYQKKHMVN